MLNVKLLVYRVTGRLKQVSVTYRGILEEVTVPLTHGSRTKLKWFGLGSNLGLRGERPANDGLRHGTVLVRFERRGNGKGKVHHTTDREGPPRR